LRKYLNEEAGHSDISERAFQVKGAKREENYLGICELITRLFDFYSEM
jgi:hypothetical protein